MNAKTIDKLIDLQRTLHLLKVDGLYDISEGDLGRLKKRLITSEEKATKIIDYILKTK